MFLLQLTNLMRKVMKYRENVYPDLAVQFMESLQRMEDELKDRGTPYYSGRLRNKYR